MPDPRLLEDYVYKALIEHELGEMRSNLYIDFGTSLLESLYQESAVLLPGSALHNQYINYYSHFIDDWQKRPRDTTPVFTPSKLYVFEEMKEDVTIEHRTPEIGVIRSTECAIFMGRPDASLNTLNNRMFSLCETISASQPVTDLFLEYGSVDRYEIPEENTLIMSKDAKSLVLEDINVSPNVLGYLLQHESLEVLRLKFTHLRDAAVPLIFNHRNLKVLNLYAADMSHKMCKYVCHHLADLVHLERIDLSFNDLSRVSSIILNNTISPVTLKLMDTHISPELLKSICQLTSVVKLKELDLSYNTLTGHLHYLLADPPQGLQSLEELKLYLTNLNKDDIEVLTRAIQRRVLPELKQLDLGNHKLNTMQRETEKLIQTCVTHHKREMRLQLRHSVFSKRRQKNGSDYVKKHTSD